MRKYFFQQTSSRGFNLYLQVCGALLNSIALVSLVRFLTTHSSDQNRPRRARLELEDSIQCTRHFKGHDLSASEELRLRLREGQELSLAHSRPSLYGQTREGLAVKMVSLAYSPEEKGLAFFLLGDDGRIERCLSGHELECLAAAGEYDGAGACRLSVEMPSDCVFMDGRFEGELCVVPSGARILRESPRVDALSIPGKVRPDFNREG